jgi:hypothetical protein
MLNAPKTPIAEYALQRREDEHAEDQQLSIIYEEWTDQQLGPLKDPSGWGKPAWHGLTTWLHTHMSTKHRSGYRDRGG